MPTPIKHLVVLMLENRSFDHMLGFMKASQPRHRWPQRGRVELPRP